MPTIRRSTRGETSRRAALAVVLALTLPGCPGRSEPETAGREGWLAALNRERAKAGASPLQLSPALDQAAQEQAEEWSRLLGRGRSLGSPDTREVSSLLARVGYPASEWTETFVLSPEEAEPRADARTFGPALSGPYREVGIGIAYGHGGVLRVFLFGRRKEDQFAELAEGLGDRARVERDLLSQANVERRKAGSPPLALHPLLTRAAQAHAGDLLARAYFAHQSPEGQGPRDRATQAGYGGGSAEGGIALIGENLAEQDFSARQALQQWMESPPHRRNLLDPRFREMGLGLAVGAGRGTPRAIWVLELGTRAADR